MTLDKYFRSVKKPLDVENIEAGNSLENLLFYETIELENVDVRPPKYVKPGYEKLENWFFGEFGDNDWAPKLKDYFNIERSLKDGKKVRVFFKERHGNKRYAYYPTLDDLEKLSYGKYEMEELNGL